LACPAGPWPTTRKLAAVVGIDSGRVRLGAFIGGSVLLGVAAILMVLDVGVDPYAGFDVFVFAFVACIVGGVYRFFAPVVGSFVLAILQSLVVWQSSAAWGPAVVFAVLVIFLLFRPQGIMGTTRRVEEI
jgi:branched-chain amino acid transport system permease protein